MNTKNNPEGLLCSNEQAACKNYYIGDCSQFDVIKLEVGNLFIREFLKLPALVFLLSGEICVSTENVVNKKMKADNMFLVTAGDSFCGKALTDATLFICPFTQEFTLCNKFALKTLKEYVSDEEPKDNSEMVLLAIHPLLRQEIELTAVSMEKGLLCDQFQCIKQDIIFMELMGLYKKEELARMFSPLICADDDFKNRVLEIYPRVNTIKELMEELKMSSATFKRKFQNSFSISPKQWLIQKKKEKIFRDIVVSNLSIAEIAEKNDFTVNYVTLFCKKYFGKTPTELRQTYSSQ